MALSGLQVLLSPCLARTNALRQETRDVGKRKLTACAEQKEGFRVSAQQTRMLFFSLNGNFS